MKKKIMLFLSFVLMSFSMLTGCGSFIEEESLVIASITSEVLDDGRTLVIITYTDEEIEPSTFYLPKGETGEQGEQGEGIKEFTHSVDPTTGDVTFTISFTNEEIEPITYTLSNGVSVTKVDSTYDDSTGITYITIYYSNGQTSEPIPIPKGEQGVGIVDVEKTENDDGSMTVKFIYNNGNSYTCEIPAPQKGDAGKGISAIVGFEDEEKYYITFYFTDNSEPQTLDFSRPQDPSNWLTGSRYPIDSEGKNGDYYFDTLHNSIYQKVSNKWIIIIDFDDVETTYKVTFDVNADDADFPDGYEYESTYIINRGTTFYSNNKDIPIPIRTGYKFIGWFTTDSPTVVHGAFTDLTPIYSDMTLYAKWELKAE